MVGAIVSVHCVVDDALTWDEYAQYEEVESHEW
jgi:hypothetical protein